MRTQGNHKHIGYHMATQENYLDYSGLTLYNELIHNDIVSASTESTDNCVFIGSDDGSGITPEVITDPTAVKFTEQTLSPTEQAQARTNISAASQTTVTQLSGNTAAADEAIRAAFSVISGITGDIDEATKVLRNGKVFIMPDDVNHGVLTQAMMNQPNTIYVISGNMTLSGNSVNVPSGSTLSFEGGTISNGTMTGYDTVVISESNKSPFNGVTRMGTWQSEDDVDVPYSGGTYNGMGRIVLKKHYDSQNPGYDKQPILQQSDFLYENTIYVVRYDFIVNSNVTVPAGCVLRFEGGSIYVNSGCQLDVRAKIEADPNAHIFDCADTPTNYSKLWGDNQVSTTCPIILTNYEDIKEKTCTPISVKWFGATGLGYTAYGKQHLEEYNQVDKLPDNFYYNDTKAIRLALTALARNIQGDKIGSNCVSTILYFPVGCYCIDDALYVSCGTSLMGDIENRPINNTWIIQTNPSKDFIVLQSQGVGGIGGGGSAHVMRDLTLNVRLTGNTHFDKGMIKFEDNVFNLDSSFYNMRINGGYNTGSLFYINGKNSRVNNENGWSDNPYMIASIHITDCMIDVLHGYVINSGTKGVFQADFNNVQIFGARDGLIYSATKENDVPWNETILFNKCSIQNCGTSEIWGKSLIWSENPLIDINITNCYITGTADSQTRYKGFVRGKYYRFTNNVVDVLYSPSNKDTDGIAFRDGFELIKITDNVFKSIRSVSGYSHLISDVCASKITDISRNTMDGVDNSVRLVGIANYYTTLPSPCPVICRDNIFYCPDNRTDLFLDGNTRGIYKNNTYVKDSSVVFVADGNNISN